MKEIKNTNKNKYHRKAEILHIRARLSSVALTSCIYRETFVRVFYEIERLCEALQSNFEADGLCVGAVWWGRGIMKP